MSATVGEDTGTGEGIAVSALDEAVGVDTGAGDGARVGACVGASTGALVGASTGTSEGAGDGAHVALTPPPHPQHMSFELKSASSYPPHHEG